MDESKEAEIKRLEGIVKYLLDALQFIKRNKKPWSCYLMARDTIERFNRDAQERIKL
jgi:hypothetical protein